MREQIIILILLLTFSNLNAQTDEQIINEILFDLFGLQQDTILIKNLKTKTYFDYDSVSIENMTGLTIPSKIISEWKNNEEAQDYSAEWNEQLLNKKDTLFLENDTVIGKKLVFKCLSKYKIDQLFEKTKKREKIYSISKILLDNSKENAIFHFIIITWPGDFYSETILIKKVFGKWKVIERFDFTMT
jgi:hypothetical protein